MGDWPASDDSRNSGSNSSDEELESELYSVLHYTSFSEDLSPDLLEKYNIKRNDKNEFFISLKQTSVKKCEDVINNSNEEEHETELNSELKNHDSCVTVQFCDEEDGVTAISRSSKPAATPVSHSSNGYVKVSPHIAKQKVKSTSGSNCSNKVSQNLKRKAGTFDHSSPNRMEKSPHIQKNTSNKIPHKSADLNKSKDKVGIKTIIISDSESDSTDGSDVIIQEQVYDVYDISSSSSVECLSDFDNANNNMILNTVNNTTSNLFPPDDGVEEEIKFKWREVASPSSWSESMKRYYNRTSKRLKTFDCKKILDAVRGQGAWDISEEDRFPRKRPVKRCTYCRQTDHLIKNCPKRFSNCSMCGNSGHWATNCPYRMCLNCGEQNQVFVALCRRCQCEKSRKCEVCNLTGHGENTCPDTWRRYHSTVTDDLNVKPNVLNENYMCCNCGKKGHLYENCTTLYWSSYPTTYSHVQNYRELQCTTGKRKSFSNFRNERKETPRKKKKARWSDEPKFGRKRYFDENPSTPNNKNRKKRKSKSPKFKNNGGRQFKNRHSY